MKENERKSNVFGFDVCVCLSFFRLSSHFSHTFTVPFFGSSQVKDELEEAKRRFLDEMKRREEQIGEPDDLGRDSCIRSMDETLVMKEERESLLLILFSFSSYPSFERRGNLEEKMRMKREEMSVCVSFC